MTRERSPPRLVIMFDGAIITFVSLPGTAPGSLDITTERGFASVSGMRFSQPGSDWSEDSDDPSGAPSHASSSSGLRPGNSSSRRLSRRRRSRAVSPSRCAFSASESSSACLSSSARTTAGTSPIPSDLHARKRRWPLTTS